MRAVPALFATPSSGNSASHERSTYGCTLARSQTSAALKSARFGISTWAVTSCMWWRKSTSDAGVAEAFSAALGRRQLVHLVPPHPRHRRHDQLRDTEAARDEKRFLAEVDERHANLP